MNGQPICDPYFKHSIVCVRMCVHARVYVCVFVYVCVCLSCACVCVVCAYVCMCVYLCMHACELTLYFIDIIKNGRNDFIKVDSPPF